MSISVEFLDCLGSNKTVANAARVSFAVHTDEFRDKDKRLLRYLGQKQPLGTVRPCAVEPTVKSAVICC